MICTKIAAFERWNFHAMIAMPITHSLVNYRRNSIRMKSRDLLIGTCSTRGSVLI